MTTPFKTRTVILYNRVQVGEDEFHRPVYEEVPEEVHGVLIEPVSSDDVTNTQNLSGNNERHRLALPKGDTHVWENRRVSFYGRNFRTIGVPIEGIEENIPKQIPFHKQVLVERYG